MELKPIKFVYFDAGMVLYEWPSGLADRLHEEVWGKHFFRTLREFDRELCLGQMSLEDACAIVSHEHGVALGDLSDPYGYLNRFQQPVTMMHSVVQRVKKLYPVGLLTNMYIHMLAKLESAGKIPALSLFSTVVDSSVVHLIKPNPEIYELAQARAEVNADEILFIDDNEDNVLAAREAGWNAWQFDPKDPQVTIKRVEEALLD